MSFFRLDLQVVRAFLAGFARCSIERHAFSADMHFQFCRTRCIFSCFCTSFHNRAACLFNWKWIYAFPAGNARRCTVLRVVQLVLHSLACRSIERHAFSFSWKRMSLCRTTCIFSWTCVYQLKMHVERCVFSAGSAGRSIWFRTSVGFACRYYRATSFSSWFCMSFYRTTCSFKWFCMSFMLFQLVWQVVQL